MMIGRSYGDRVHNNNTKDSDNSIENYGNNSVVIIVIL